jgi:hypothetical protein
VLHYPTGREIDGAAIVIVVEKLFDVEAILGNKLEYDSSFHDFSLLSWSADPARIPASLPSWLTSARNDL